MSRILVDEEIRALMEKRGLGFGKKDKPLASMTDEEAQSTLYKLKLLDIEIERRIAEAEADENCHHVPLPDLKDYGL